MEWVETTEEVVITEECVPPENNTSAGMRRLHFTTKAVFVYKLLSLSLYSCSDVSYRASRDANPEVTAHCGA